MIVHGLRATIDAAYLPYVEFKGTDHHNFANSGWLQRFSPEKAPAAACNWKLCCLTT
jgi:hypothetical protein